MDGTDGVEIVDPTPVGDFTYVLIPAADSAELVERNAPLAGGLECDEVQRAAKVHFFGLEPGAWQMVDISTVYLPAVMNGYIGVSLYSHADDSLPVNTRATLIAKACGHTKTIIYGDAFLSRCYDNEDEPWVRRDLFAIEATVNADWVLEAGEKNKGRNMNAYTSGGTAGKTLHQLGGAGASITPGAFETVAGSALVAWTQSNGDIEVS
jgi:hypothetical protein